MLLISFGTRPEYIKIKPLLEIFEDTIPYALLFTGQHTSLLEHVVDAHDVRELNIAPGENRLDSIVASIMNQGSIFEGISAVMVQGDTTSAFAVALASFHRKIDIIHLEAGLRTGDLQNPYPEEFNRQAISRMATLHLCPTETSAINLAQENITDNVYVVGNTVLDNLKDVSTSYGNTILVTMHRRENHRIMDQWFTAINDLAGEYPQYDFILPIHPNPNVQRHRALLTDVKVVPPLDHDEFVRLLAHCRFAITDSGGLQEEGSFLRKKCIVCRKTTERTEGINVFSYMCHHPRELEVFFQFLELEENYKVSEDLECPYGKGTSAQQILNVLKEVKNQ